MPFRRAHESEPGATRPGVPRLFCRFEPPLARCFPVVSLVLYLLASDADGATPALPSLARAASASSTLENEIPFRGWTVAVSGSARVRLGRRRDDKDDSDDVDVDAEETRGPR